jgi:hypothetical protein
MVRHSFAGASGLKGLDFMSIEAKHPIMTNDSQQLLTLAHSVHNNWNWKQPLTFLRRSR